MPRCRSMTMSAVVLGSRITCFRPRRNWNSSAARGQRRHLGAQLVIARREELVLAGQAADFSLAAVDLLARHADRQLAPAPQREEHDGGGHPPAAAVEPVAHVDDIACFVIVFDS